MRFKGKSVVITGGDKGIGRATALAFAEEGAKIVIGYFRDKAAADMTRELVERFGSEIALCKFDVRVRSDCIKLIDLGVGRYGRLDIAVNNAGVSTMNWAVDLTEEEWDFNMDVNAKGVFLCCQAEVRQFIKQGGGGKIINIGSIASKRPAQLLAHYAASKFAVLGFTKSLASEVARHNINVNCVCPGLVKTSMQDREVGWEAKLRGISAEKVKEEYREAIPLGRLEEPEDVAKLILFLASDDANYITGQAFNVAGGMEMAV
jgi:NAD(P)-dependent dehydrogenase (short-subunit alcohol dehydrogenase family)